MPNPQWANKILCDAKFTLIKAKLLCIVSILNGLKKCF